MLVKINHRYRNQSAKSSTQQHRPKDWMLSKHQTGQLEPDNLLCKWYHEQLGVGEGLYLLSL